VGEVTLRERIIKLLMECEEPLTASEIATALGVNADEVDIYEHLRHIAKTVRRLSNNKMMLYMIPPRCRLCGYVFKDIDRPRKPSKCPVCKSERIEDPRFKIM